MSKVENIEDFYKRKFGWMPDNIKNEIGHFNVFKPAPIKSKVPPPVPYKRRDFFKITLAIGNYKIHYADKVVEVKKQTLVFSNPFIPYTIEGIEKIKKSYYCIFNQQFFHHYGNLHQYSLFQPQGTHVFELTDEQLKKGIDLFEQMLAEISSNYIHKYDVLRTNVFELIHFAMKMQPSTAFNLQPINAAKRIATLFLELLERQFPIEDNHPKVQLRSASAFAKQLNVHVNHLNRAIKDTTDKTTTQIIAERILQEAKILLKHSAWNVSEIAYALGFTEVTHFNNFFKKYTQLSPLKFRNV